MMSKLSKTLSSVLIGLLDVDFNNFAFLSFSKFSFVSQNFQESKSADSGQQCVSNVCFWVLWRWNIIIYKIETMRTCPAGPTQYFIVKTRVLENPQIEFSFLGLPHGTQRFRNFYGWKVWCLSFQTHIRTSLYDV